MSPSSAHVAVLPGCHAIDVAWYRGHLTGAPALDAVSAPAGSSLLTSACGGAVQLSQTWCDGTQQSLKYS